MSQFCHLCSQLRDPTSLHRFLADWNYSTSINYSGHNSPTRARAVSFFRFLDHTQWHTPVGRTPLDGWSARRRDLYLTTLNTHWQETDIHAPGGGIQNRSSSERSATDPRLRPAWKLSRKIQVSFVFTIAFISVCFTKCISRRPSDQANELKCFYSACVYIWLINRQSRDCWSVIIFN